MKDSKFATPLRHLLFSGLVIGLHLIFLGIRYDTNDDFAILLGFRGYLSLGGVPLESLGPTPHYIGWSHLFVFFYRILPMVPWYGLFILTGTTLSLAVAAAAIRPFLFARGATLVATLCAYALLFPNLDRVNFTRIPILLVGGALIWAFSRGLQKRESSWQPWILVVAVVASYFIRDLSALAAFAVIAPGTILLSRRENRIPFLKHAVLPTALALAAAFFFVNDVWKSPYSRVLKMSYQLNDYGGCGDPAPVSPETASMNQAFKDRFVSDRGVMSENRVRAAYLELGCANRSLVPFDLDRRLAALTFYFRQQSLAYVFMFVALSTFSLFYFRRKSLNEIGFVLLLFSALSVCALRFKIEDRVFQPMLAEGGILVLVWGLSLWRTKRSVNRNSNTALALVAVCLTLALGLRGRTPYRETQAQVETLKATLANFNALRKTHRLSVTADTRDQLIPNGLPLFAESLYLEQPEWMPIDFLASWTFQSDSYVELIRERSPSGTYVDFFSELVRRPQALLLATDPESQFLKQYFALFYKKKLVMKDAEGFPDSARLRPSIRYLEAALE